MLKAVYGSDYNNSNFVIGEFICEEISGYDSDDILYFTRLCDTSCVSKVELLGYKKDSDYLFGWHISDLKIYDEPKDLTDFRIPKKCNSCKVSGYENCCPYDEKCIVPAVLSRPPQSWQYVEEL